MAESESTFEIKKGETGKVMPFTLKSQGSPFGLAGWTVTLTTKKGSTVYINNAACVVDPDQVANKGKGTFTFSAPNAAHPAGRYKLEFKAVNGSNVVIFPCDDDEPYGELIVLDPLQ